MLGRTLQREFADHELVVADLPEWDIVDDAGFLAQTLEVKPDLIIHCAAMTRVDDCEEHRDLAFKLNEDGSRNVALAARAVGARLIAISTDYVFSGEPPREPWAWGEMDIPRPRTVYGMSKFAGEQMVQMIYPDNSVILRIAWLYGHGGPSFVHTMARLGAETGEPLKVVDDQRGNPTSAKAVADVIRFLLSRPDVSGVVHATCEDQCSWYEFAKEIFRLMNLKRELKPVSTAEFPRPAPRPRCSALKKSVLNVLGYRTPKWQEALAEFIATSMRTVVLLLMLAISGASQAVPVEWVFPRTGNCHEGIPFADGKTGVLVWGGGGIINMTVGRSDMWDHRGGYEWTDEQSYTNIIAAVETRDNERLRRLFRNDPPPGWGGKYNPYMLPLGRVRVKLSNLTLKSGTLDPMTGMGEIAFAEGGKARMAMSVERGTFALEFPQGAEFSVESIPATEASVYEEVLRPRGFEKAIVFDKSGKEASGGFNWRLPADVSATVVWRRKGPVLAVASSRGEHIALPETDFSLVASNSKSYWRKFWREGARIKVPDAKIQRIFEYGMYRFGAMTDPGGIPAGLQGPWLEDDKLVPWNGDYHFNINVQECYAPAYRGGHFANLMPLFRMVLSWRERLRENARKFVGIDNGYTLPHSVDDRGVCIGGFWAGTIDHGSTAWVAAMMFRYVKYSGDVEFLRNFAYDFMQGAMNVYRAMMEEDGGKLSLPMAPSPEWGDSDVKNSVGRNSSFQLAAAHRLARDLIQGAKMLGEEPSPMWLEVEEKLPPFTADETGICLFEGQRFVETHRHHSHMAGFFPFDTIDLSDPATRKIAHDTYFTWVDRGTGKWSGWCVPWAAVLNIHLGSAERAVDLLRAWDTYYCDEGHGSHHNAVVPGFTAWCDGRDVMQMDGQCAAAAAVLELMAHEIDGKVEFFKGCPESWGEVSFENLRLSDGRRVNGRRSGGKITIEEL